MFFIRKNVTANMTSKNITVKRENKICCIPIMAAIWAKHILPHNMDMAIDMAFIHAKLFMGLFLKSRL